MIAIPNRTLVYLSIACAALLATYVAIMVSTILFDALQTQLARNVQNTQMEITRLETAYYAAISELDDMDPHTLGYVTPRSVEYVTATRVPGLSFAQ